MVPDIRAVDHKLVVVDIPVDIGRASFCAVPSACALFVRPTIRFACSSLRFPYRSIVSPTRIKPFK